MSAAKVEQCDREAAAEAYRGIAGCTIPLNFPDKVLAGGNSELVQAFARHRLAERERCAKIADDAAASFTSRLSQACARVIAKRIRS